MQTRFTAAQLGDSATAAAAGAIRNCVHCGFCNATCPTYALLGDELDSPRGRIYLIKEMLEKAALPSPQVVKHLDRCLSCLACETHCPSGVSYRRIIDQGRRHIEAHYRRPWRDRLLRAGIAQLLPYRGRMRVVLALAAAARPLAPIFQRIAGLRPLAAMLRLSSAARLLRGTRRGVREEPPSAQGREQTPPRLRVGMMQGCVEPILDPAIQAAAERLLRRAGCEVVRLRREGCCGALSHHLGREAQALCLARAEIDAWWGAHEHAPLDAIVVSASGCGTVIRDYGFLLRDEPSYAVKAARVAALACDISEWMDRIGLPALKPVPGTVVGYHAACSLQHGQGVNAVPQRLLAAAGFEVRIPADAHLCCGSAGVYNILQPDIAAQLGARKASSLARLAPDVIATGNIGCMVQLAGAGGIPVVHVAELLDWATGGPRPRGMPCR